MNIYLNSFDIIKVYIFINQSKCGLRNIINSNPTGPFHMNQTNGWKPVVNPMNIYFVKELDVYLTTELSKKNISKHSCGGAVFGRFL